MKAYLVYTDGAEVVKEVDGQYHQHRPAGIVEYQVRYFTLSTLQQERWPDGFTYHEATVWRLI